MKKQQWILVCSLIAIMLGVFVIDFVIVNIADIVPFMLGLISRYVKGIRLHTAILAVTAYLFAIFIAIKIRK